VLVCLFMSIQLLFSPALITVNSTGNFTKKYLKYITIIEYICAVNLVYDCCCTSAKEFMTMLLCEQITQTYGHISMNVWRDSRPCVKKQSVRYWKWHETQYMTLSHGLLAVITSYQLSTCGTSNWIMACFVCRQHCKQLIVAVINYLMWISLFCLGRGYISSNGLWL